ncbi:hypothetical protein M9H77_24223 [Catharanthus roseus]|uniref:Uncharacterized protein n=1 Tax=Catharanthus roseus TaxID=4058 RepID=A0ACC0AVI7_CATRO|nr:hypothetical protein M9H77_24223 [Catharanthus roseus]
MKIIFSLILYLFPLCGFAAAHTLHLPTSRALSGDNTGSRQIHLTDPIQPYRSCLLSRHVQGLICTRNWFYGFIHSETESNDDEETMESKLKESLSSKADSNFLNVSEDEDDEDDVEE